MNRPYRREDQDDHAGNGENRLRGTIPAFSYRMEDGTVWHVHDPEMIHLGRDRIRLATGWSEIEDEARTQELTLLMNRVASIQYLD